MDFLTSKITVQVCHLFFLLFNWALCLLLLFRSSFFTLNTNPCRVYVANAAFPSVVCFFTLFMVSFNEQKFLILMESNLLVFSLWFCFKTLFLPSGQEDNSRQY